MTSPDTNRMQPDFQSDCFEAFGHADFDFAKCVPEFVKGCPVNECRASLQTVSFGKSALPYCTAHGIRLHSNTFVYWNGHEGVTEAKLRNFAIRKDLAREIALSPGQKVESHRLGYEMSEDALSWNVFVGFAEAGKLRDAVRFLTDREVEQEPRLYLRGELVDLDHGKRERFARLEHVRRLLEPDIGKFKTEPDIMLVVDGQLIVCIEASSAPGIQLLMKRRCCPEKSPRAAKDCWSVTTNEPEDGHNKPSRWIRSEKTFHTQIFRNVVFACEMANGCDWHVVNLVSSTQLRLGKESIGYSFGDPSELVTSYLGEAPADRFTYRTWESLHDEVIGPAGELSRLSHYMRTKSAHFKPAFVLDPALHYG